MTTAVKRTPSDRIAGKPTTGRGILGPVAQARKDRENEYRTLLVDIHRQRVQLLELHGREPEGDRQGDRQGEPALTPEQLQELSALEEQALTIGSQICALIEDRNNGRSKARFYDGGAARHGIPGTVDVVGKLHAMKELFHADATVTHDEEGRVVDITELEQWNSLSRMQKVADYDRKTRDFSVMILRAAEGDADALREFYRCFCHKTLPKAKVEGTLADRFTANMMGRTPENRAELIYRWSGMNQEHCEHAAGTPKDVPIVKIKLANLSFTGDIAPLIENALKKCKLIVEGPGRITGLPPRDSADMADRTSYVTRKNKDYARN